MISAKPAKNEKCQNICFSNIWRRKCIIMVLNLHRRQWMSNILRWRQNSRIYIIFKMRKLKKYIFKFVYFLFIFVLVHLQWFLKKSFWTSLSFVIDLFKHFYCSWIRTNDFWIIDDNLNNVFNFIYEIIKKILI